MSAPKYDPKKTYVVAAKKSVTSLKGVRSAGMEVSESMFAAGRKEDDKKKNGEEAMKRMVADGTFVVKPKEAKKSDDKKSDDKKSDDKKSDGKKDK